MNSACHYGLAAGTSWFIEGVCGISPLEPGYRKILVKPYPDQRAGYAQGVLDTASGRIRSSWRFSGNAFRLEVGIPPNTTAEIWVPNFGGQEILASPELKPVEVKDGFTVFHTGSGDQSFEITRCH